MFIIPKKEKKIHVNVEINEELLNAVRVHLKEQHLTMRQVVESGLLAFLDEMKKKLNS